MLHCYVHSNGIAKIMGVDREKTNKMQQSDVYYQLLSQHVSGIITSTFGRTKTVLLHMVFVLLMMGIMMPETC